MNICLSKNLLSVAKVTLFSVLLGAMFCARAEQGTDTAASLRTQYVALKEQLQHNQFKRQLVLDSSETPDRLKGNVYAVVDYPYNVVQTGLNHPDHWCDILLLHLNTKYCHAENESSGTILNVNIGKKTPEELADSTRIEFDYKVAASTLDYLKIMLNAKEGPLGTSDYRIVLEATTLENAKTFIHLTYSYSASMTGRLAMKTYLATAGNGKVGFTVVGKQADGTPDYISGVRGLIERNTMRYYLAIDAFLGAANIAPNARLEKRLQTWFTATEHYRRQLHEVERSDYLEMKRAENVRQLTMR